MSLLLCVGVAAVGHTLGNCLWAWLHGPYRGARPWYLSAELWRCCYNEPASMLI